MLKKILTNNIFIFLCRLVLGGIFIYASIDKIIHPAAFARDIANYKILTSPMAINLTAVVLPWTELVAGLFLIIGLWQKGATTILASLLVLFIIVLTITVLRGIDINCGCFDTQGASKVGFDLIIRDTILLLCTLPLFFNHFKYKSFNRIDS